MKEFLKWLDKYLDGTPGTHLVDVKAGLRACKTDTDKLAFMKKANDLDGQIISRLDMVVLPDTKVPVGPSKLV